MSWVFPYNLIAVAALLLSVASGFKVPSFQRLQLRPPVSTVGVRTSPLFASPPAKTFPPLADDPFTHLASDLSKFIQSFLKTSQNPTVVGSLKAWSLLPVFIKKFLAGIAFGDFFVFGLFQLTYRRSLRWAHQLQIIVWKWLALGTPLPFKNSILGFAEERGNLLAKIMGCNYVIKLGVRVLQKLGFQVDAGLSVLLSKIAYTLYGANFLDLFKAQFLHTFFPSLADNRRSSYVLNRSIAVIIWIVGVLAVCEMISTYFKVPLSSTLAFGGVGGIALGLSARDIAANFLGGMLLLFNEPFTPGDMVTFRSGSTECVGRVERVGWGQTRIRGRDTRPTYVPNSHFVSTAVTNMERISHRKYEATIPIRFQDHAVMPEILTRLKEALRALPKLDVLGMPYRVSFVRFGPYALEIEITCYFSTKSIDEFLALQQMANLEVVRVIRECGAQLALPTTLIHVPATSDPLSMVQSIIQPAPQQVALGSVPQLTQQLQQPQQQQNQASVVVPVSVPVIPPEVRKKDLPPFVSSAQATASAASSLGSATLVSTKVSGDPSAAVVSPASSATTTKVSGDPSVAGLSPAAAAILSRSQAGSYIAETLLNQKNGVVGASASGGKIADAAAPKTERRVVVGPTIKAGFPDQTQAKQEPSNGSKSPQQPQQQQQPQQPTQFQQQQQLLQQQLLQQQLQQQLAQQAASALAPKPPLSRDGSISWSWIEIESDYGESDDQSQYTGQKARETF